MDQRTNQNGNYKGVGTLWKYNLSIDGMLLKQCLGKFIALNAYIRKEKSFKSLTSASNLN